MAAIQAGKPSLHRTRRQWKINGWGVGTTLIAATAALPVVAVFYLALAPTENIWPHLSRTLLPDYLANTLTLMLGVGTGTFILGVTCAWLVTFYRFPWRRHLQWGLLLPFAVPSYVIAYVYTDLLEYAGAPQTLLRHLFQWETARDYWFPEIRSMGGAITMFSLVLYPYVYMLARAAFLEQSPSLCNASRTLGCSSWQAFWRISLPLARPAIAVGLSLVLMETLNDIGTVEYFAVRTLTAGIFDTWLNLGNLGGAAQIAALMLLFVIALISIEKRGRSRQRQYSGSGEEPARPARKILSRRKAWLATVFCTTLILVAFVLPFGLLIRYSVQYWEVSWTSQFMTYAGNSFLLSLLAASTTAILGLWLAYTARLQGKHRLIGFAYRVSNLGYALPGAVLALGILVPLAAFDNGLDSLMRSWFGISTGLLLSGTFFGILMAYTIRFLTISTGSIDSALTRITPNMDLASRSLGESTLGTLIRVHFPLIRRGILTGALIVFVDCMKELPATLLLRPFNFETLATYVYQYASDELLEECALAACVIVAVGIVPVLLLNRAISHQRNQE